MLALLKFKSFLIIFAMLLISLSLPFEVQSVSEPSSRSARFNGGNQQRMTIPITNSSINIGAGNFTIEFWMKPILVTASAGCSNGIDVFTNGGLLIDRDQWGSGNNGDFGISIMSDRRLAFSIHNGSTGTSVCSTPLSLNTWYYIAAVKAGNTIAIYVNGILSQSRTFTGNTDLSYNFSHSYDPACPNPCQDATFVIGAEKHSVGYNYNGLLDELRISNNARTITPQNATFSVDSSTVALYRFEGNGNSATGNFGGITSSISYLTDVPFIAPSQSPSLSPTNSPIQQPPQTIAPTQSASPRPNQPTTPFPSQAMNPVSTPSPTSTNESLLLIATQDITTTPSPPNTEDNRAETEGISEIQERKNPASRRLNLVIVILSVSMLFVALLLVTRYVYLRQKKIVK
jgi:Concanavalin A-like lectin/glucanases superfamily